MGQEKVYALNGINLDVVKGDLLSVWHIRLWEIDPVEFGSRVGKAHSGQYSCKKHSN